MATGCAQACLSKKISPAGSVKILLNSTKRKIGYVLVQTVKKNDQWKRKIEAEEELFENLTRYFSRNPRVDIRLQALSKKQQPINHTTVIIYLRKKESHGPFTRYEYRLPVNNVFENIIAIFENNMNSPFRIEASTRRDILVCTHLQRDNCCGSFGVKLYHEVAKYEDDMTKVWMSSHIGGHRMAPTILDLPYARYWGYVTGKFVERLIQKADISLHALQKHYRGFAGLHRSIQLADRFAISSYQWDWMETPFRVETINQRFTVKNEDGIEIQGEITEPEKIFVGETACADLKSVLIPTVRLTPS